MILFSVTEQNCSTIPVHYLNLKEKGKCCQIEYLTSAVTYNYSNYYDMWSSRSVGFFLLYRRRCPRMITNYG